MERVSGNKPFNKIKISAENFRIIQPLLVTSRNFGLCPISYTKTGSSYILQWSLFYAGYSYLIIISAILLAIFGLINDMNWNEMSHRMKDKKSKIIAGSDISIVIIIAIFCISSTSCRMRVFWKLLCCCNKIDNTIPLTNSKKLRNKSIILICLVLASFTFMEIFDVVVWSNSSKHRGYFSYLRDYCGFYLLYYIIVVQEIFFWHLIFFVKIRIALLNEYLMFEDSQELRNLNLVNMYLENLNVFRKSHRNVSISFKKNMFLDSSAEIGFYERISTLAKLYKNISSSIESINSSIANGIVLIVLSCLDHLIVTPYFLVKEVTANSGNGVFICLQASWITTHIFLLLIIVEPCHLCLKESRRTLHLLCSLLALQNIEKEDRRLLEIFTMELAEKKIRFSCCGLFKINRPLITSLAGAVTTYLVILFQLNN